MKDIVEGQINCGTCTGYKHEYKVKFDDNETKKEVTWVCERCSRTNHIVVRRPINGSYKPTGEVTHRPYVGNRVKDEQGTYR